MEHGQFGPCFNPRPGHSTGATHDRNSGRYVPVVSIRAPVTRPGRQVLRQQGAGGGLFQSAPRSLDRGDATSARCGSSPSRFNPRPGHSTGATRAFVHVSARDICFNPRPGHSTGATAARLADLEPKMFQSAPRSLDRGDTSARSKSRARLRFNPRPGHSTGATGAAARRRGSGLVSIRAPVTRPGRHSVL